MKFRAVERRLAGKEAADQIRAVNGHLKICDERPGHQPDRGAPALDS